MATTDARLRSGSPRCAATSPGVARAVITLAFALVGAACSRVDVDGAADSGVDASVDAGDNHDAGPVLDGGVDGGVDHSAPLWDGTVNKARSLVWTDGALLDDKSVVGLARVANAAAVSMGTNGGSLVDAWLKRFATTAHSERAGPARLAQQLEQTLGADPSTWNLDDAPFKVTGVHNRVDLMGTDENGTPHCGQLRVSLASTDPILRPFHVLFLFRQPARDGDVDAQGALTCQQTALMWARLSDIDDAHVEDFRAAARAILDDSLVGARFLLAETVELTVSPWEWRQWVPVPGGAAAAGARVLDNPPLFEQVDVAGVNAPGALRDQFVAFVDENAAALDARTLVIPERFRAPSIRVTQGAAWVPVDLSGVSSSTAAAFPDLRKHLEIVGCAACHTADAEFVQTREDRTFSPFYTKELTARAQLVDDILHRVPRAIPFGPLQDAPLLPP